VETKGKYEVKQEIKMVEWFDDHWYWVEVAKKYFASSTTKLGVVAKPFLATWRGNVGNREADMRVFEAGERGKRIHSAFETLLKGGTVVYNPPGRPNYTKEEIEAITVKCGGFLEIMKYQEEALQVHKIMQFLNIVKPEILGSEMMVYSLADEYAGTMDALLKIKEGKYLVNGRTPLFIPGGIYAADLKTGKSLDEDSTMQTASYGNAHTEMTKQKVDGTMLLWTGSSNKNGIEGFGVELRNQIEMQQDYSDFKHVCKVWDRKNKDKQPRNFEFPTMFTLKGELK